jgi:hypothetical protein
MPKIKLNHEEVELIDSIITESTISCSNKDCLESDSTEYDTLEAAEYFYKEGWRVTCDDDGLPICPSCVKKIKRANKKKKK